MNTAGGIPKFERRSVFVLLIFWGIALLCWVPVLVYEAKHPNTSGELDLGGAGLMAITLFVSEVFVLCGIVAVTHAFISFIWRRWRWGNQITLISRVTGQLLLQQIHISGYGVNRPNGLSTRMVFISVAEWFETHIFYERKWGDLATIPISSWRIAREGLFF
jgi:hypothetical protein